MPVPGADEISRPLLEAFIDGEAHDFDFKYIEDFICSRLNIEKKSISTTEKRIFKQNIKIARTFLKKHGLLFSPEYFKYKITDTGREVLKIAPEIINEDFFKNFVPSESSDENLNMNVNVNEDFENNNSDEIDEDSETLFDSDDEEIQDLNSDENINPENINATDDSDNSDLDDSGINIEGLDDVGNTENQNIENDDVPIFNENEEDNVQQVNPVVNLAKSEETAIVPSYMKVDDVIERINNNLAEEMLDYVSNLSQDSFEQLVVDLLSKMGYRAFRNARYTNEISGDNSIHGVILEDRAGLNPIYIQAKKLNPEKVVGRAELQEFSRVLADRGGKGLFATAANFSEQAEQYAKDEHLMLIDGIKLAQLMISQNFCVSVERVIEIKAIDKESLRDYAR